MGWGGVSEFVSQIQKDPSYGTLKDYLQTASPEILAVAQQHLTYPILHYYHSSVATTSLPVQLAILDEALRKFPDEAFEKQPELHLLVPNCPRAITEFLVTLTGVFIRPCEEEPPRGQEMEEDCLSANLVQQHSTISISRRRKLLRALIEADGWEWDAIQPQ